MAWADKPEGPWGDNVLINLLARYNKFVMDGKRSDPLYALYEAPIISRLDEAKIERIAKACLHPRCLGAILHIPAYGGHYICFQTKTFSFVDSIPHEARSSGAGWADGEFEEMYKKKWQPPDMHTYTPSNAEAIFKSYMSDARAEEQLHTERVMLVFEQENPSHTNYGSNIYKSLGV